MTPTRRAPVAVLAAALCGSAAHADTLPLPPAGEDLIGEYLETTAGQDDTLIDIGQRFGLGYEELTNANPGVDPWVPGEGTVVRLPKRRILPDAPREGIVVNLPEHRLYYFPPAKPGQPRVVVTYPVSIGKMDWSTPLGVTKVVEKVKDPIWYPPESVRQEHAKRGDFLPRAVPAGPDNPMGQYKMRLGIPGGAYLIHGTNNAAGIGMQVTHGCMRLYPVDIEALYKMVPMNTAVRLVNQPQKVGWSGGQLYVEVHPPLASMDERIVAPDLTDLARQVTTSVRVRPAMVEWVHAEQAFEEARGMPLAVTPPVAAQVAQQ